ncbi:M56 family metallopeptidase, partial [Novilysobacter arseniciresistens]|uniref:M56 family metallopeptidase n=1 Tax=Novilysobacter arseniciresistens TaxID=1385522 RepID=UPI00068A11B3
MEAAELLRVLVELAVASGVAIVLVLLLRAPLRRRFGAAAGYGAWWLVPVSMVAVLLPAAPATSPGVSMVLAIGNAVPQALAAGAVDGGGGAPAWLVVWLSGTVVMALAFARRQRRFRRALGRLQPRGDGLLQAAGRGGLPATVGLFPPRIVVPVDFDRAYSDEQRRLMLAHERCHVRHGDLQANAAVLALRSVFWFNPLVHLAARHFRHDQELACDQRVVARHPHARRAYGEAMFKAQLAAQPLPLGCHWGYGHPLKERIAMLRQPAPTRSRRLGGILAVVALGLATGYGAWAAQPASQPVLVVSPAGHMPPPPPPPAAPEPPPAPPAP